MSASPSTPAFDPERVRLAFPVLNQRVRGGQPLVYLDNAATTQKPLAVIEAVSRYYREDNANVHRGVHALSERATLAFDAARRTVAGFVGAASPSEIVFTRGTTEAINLVAQSWGRANLREGDEIVLSAMEHHANIVPWQMLREQTGAVIRVAPMDDRGQLDLDAFERLVTSRTKLVGVVHASNALGTINPIRRIVEIAHAHGARVLVDGAQATPHLPVDVQALGCDFYALSGHKVYAPTGIGALYGRRELLESMPPWQGGGDMILTVSFDETVYAGVPSRFEAGTPNIAGAIGLAAALDWLSDLGLEQVAAHERALLGYATEALETVPGLRLVGTAEHKVGVLSFVIDGAHPHDVGTVLDMKGVAVRAGHHCAQPVMTRFGIPATTRASLAAYNTRADVDRLVEALGEVVAMFGGAA